MARIKNKMKLLVINCSLHIIYDDSDSTSFLSITWRKNVGTIFFFFGFVWKIKAHAISYIFVFAILQRSTDETERKAWYRFHSTENGHILKTK